MKMAAQAIVDTKNQATTNHPDKIRWNEKYKQKGLEAFGAEPAEWLVAHESLLVEQPKGFALDLACGNGRNAFYLAKLGFTVDAVDISDVALSWLQKQVRERQVAVHPKVMNLETALLPKHRYQVILNINYLERSIFDGIKEALLPDGLLFFETMTKDHIAILGNQMNPKFVLDYNELLHAFSDLRILHYREAIVWEGSCDKTKAAASLVARRMSYTR
jgi:2-polyprenyl-3-methyl-5-hydroxy-6-metoxy-1,4-benzoquinol methylase